MLPTATHRDETAPHAASHRGGVSSGAGIRAGSLSLLGCHQALTQSPQQLMGWSPHGSHSCPVPAILCFSGGCLSLGISSISSEHHPSTTISVHQQKRPSAQQQPNERLTAPHLVRAVPTVVQPVTPLIGIDPGRGVTAVEHQVSRKAVGQVTCMGKHTGHVLSSTGHRHID